MNNLLRINPDTCGLTSAVLTATARPIRFETTGTLAVVTISKSTGIGGGAPLPPIMPLPCLFSPQAVSPDIVKSPIKKVNNFLLADMCIYLLRFGVTMPHIIQQRKEFFSIHTVMNV
ncbi:hypothetical protein [Succinimonas sp.]|uniref:hypothetical protein n=1 Tax=Succinimonas sp. TaxID=1936151 RepID=UPI003865B6DD